MEENEPLSSARPPRDSFSFAGGGFMAMYHVGMRQAIQEQGSMLKREVFTGKLYGASVGSVVAVSIACDISHVVMLKFIRELYDVAHSVCRWGRFSLLHPKMELGKRCRLLLEKVLPPDAHRRCRGRVGVSVTVLPSMENWIISDFNTRGELMQALVCSCFVPVFSGTKIPKLRGKYCCDGGLSSNLPHSADPSVITVSPFTGECDICPPPDNESYYQCFLAGQTINICAGNTYRGLGSLFVLPWNEMESIRQQGYNDTLNFLRKEGLLPLSNDASLSVIATTTDDQEEEAGSTTSDYDSMTTLTHSRKSSVTTSS